jgi:hypothetical protein
MKVKKLGQPVPLSNLVAESKSARSQPAHANVPLRFSWSSGLEPARSVASCRRTANGSGPRRLLH